MIIKKGDKSKSIKTLNYSLADRSCFTPFSELIPEADYIVHEVNSDFQKVKKVIFAFAIID